MLNILYYVQENFRIFYYENSMVLAKKIFLISFKIEKTEEYQDENITKNFHWMIFRYWNFKVKQRLNA